MCLQEIISEQIEQSTDWSPTDGRPVVSLFAMLRFYGDLFVQTLTRIIQWEVKCSRIQNGATPMTGSMAVEIFAYVGTLTPDLMHHGLKSSALKAGRIMQRLEEGRMAVTYGEMVSLLRELRERIEDDLHTHVYLSLTEDESKLYEKPTDKWDEVVGRFRRAQYNIEEANKCFALGRYGAAVFHITLVAEFGVIKVAELFGVQGDRPGWGALQRLQKINDKPWNDRSPLERQHSEFLKNTLPLAIAIKDSWRHKMDHVDNQLQWIDTDFSPQVASEIISATCGFMRRLAADLPQPKPKAYKQDPFFPGVS